MSVFVIFGRDNDSFAFRQPGSKSARQPQIVQTLVPDLSGTPHPGVQRCAACGLLLDKWSESLAGLKLRRRGFDYSVTYDRIRVVSRRFIAVYQAHRLFGLEFDALPDDPEFFSIRVSRQIRFDVDRRQTRFVKQCSACLRYESTVGATPVYLTREAAIDVCEFARTDVEFGSGDGKSPLLLCGSQAAAALSAAKLSGIELEAVQP